MLHRLLSGKVIVPGKIPRNDESIHVVKGRIKERRNRPIRLDLIVQAEASRKLLGLFSPSNVFCCLRQVAPMQE